MAVEISALVIVFLALAAGGLARAVYPFIQEQKNREERLKILDLLPPDKLTDDDKAFLTSANKPLNFLRYYKYTALLGIGGTLAVTLTSFTVALSSLPTNASFTVALSMVPVFLVTGWGGGGLSNQLIKSGTSTSNVQKVTSAIVDSKIVSSVKKP